MAAGRNQAAATPATHDAGGSNLALNVGFIVAATPPSIPAQGGSTAVREAARRAAVGDFPTCTEFRTDVKDRIDSLGDEATAVISRSYSKGPGNTETGVEVGDVVTVSVTFRTPTMNFPIIPFLEDGKVSESADARVENVPTEAVETC